MTDNPVTRIANELRDFVEAVEARPANTRGHYGTYMVAISHLAEDRAQRAVLAKALIEAGANERGVMDALRICQ